MKPTHPANVLRTAAPAVPDATAPQDEAPTRGERSWRSDYERFDRLTFESFRALACQPGLSRHERVGFPDSYREGREDTIFRDITAKLGPLQQRDQIVLEIGPGCSALPAMLAALCERQSHRLIFVDSAEMLARLPEARHIQKFAGPFPDAMRNVLDELQGRVNAILAYSVVQYVFVEGNLWDFFDRSLGLLAPGGEMLLGDIPNSTMRKRYLASAAGERSHQLLTGRNGDKPEVVFNALEPGQMDDSVVLHLLARARSQGFHAWVLPQPADLPMGNRREDLLIRRP